MQAVWAGSAECLGLILQRSNPNLWHPRFGRTILQDVAGLGLKNTAEQSRVLAAVLLDAGARDGPARRGDVKHSAGMGVPLGKDGTGQPAAGAGRRPGGSRCRALGVTAGLGGEDGTPRDCRAVADSGRHIGRGRRAPHRIWRLRSSTGKATRPVHTDGKPVLMKAIASMRKVELALEV